MSRKTANPPQQKPIGQGKVCPKCDTPGQTDDRFCGACGSQLPLAKELSCGSCGAEIMKDDKFCFSCGTKVVKQKAKPPRRKWITAQKKRAAKKQAASKKNTTTKPTSQAQAQPQGAGESAKPSRWWPATRVGRVILVAAVVFAVIAGLSLEEDQEGATALLPLILTALYLIWRNILISFGLLGSNAPTAVSTPKTGPEPEQNGKGGHGAIILMVVFLIAALAGIRACGDELSHWLS